MFGTIFTIETGELDARREIFDILFSIATKRRFIAPDTAFPVRSRKSLNGWTLEQKGPRHKKADFVLAVHAPLMCGIHPLFPLLQTIAGPLFVVVIHREAGMLVWHECPSFIQGKMEINSIVRTFHDFLDCISRSSRLPHREKKEHGENLASTGICFPC